MPCTFYVCVNWHFNTSNQEDANQIYFDREKMTMMKHVTKNKKLQKQSHSNHFAQTNFARYDWLTDKAGNYIMKHVSELSETILNLPM